MPLLIIFLKGVLIGFSIAAPVGPVGFLCIRTTIKNGPGAGFAIGAGAACADTVYAALGAFGVALVKGLIARYAWIWRFIGGLFLIYLGVRTIRATKTPAPADVQVSAAHLFRAFSSTFFITMTNPATVFAFIAIFAAAGLNFADGFHAAVAVMGVFAGSLGWWLFLSSLVAHLRKKITDATLHHINMGAGAIIAVFGAFAFLSAFW